VESNSWFDGARNPNLGLRAKIIREAVISRVCLARVQSYKQCELEIRQGEYLHSLLNTPVFINKFREHDADLSEDDDRELFFERKVGHLIPFAQKFEFLDAFFSRNVVDRKSGATFVLDKCLSAEIPLIEIHTFEADENPALTDVHIEKIIQRIQALYDQKPRVSRVTIKIYGGDKSSFPHDRFGEIAFLHKSLGFSIGQGSEVFGSGIQRPAPVFEPIKRRFQDLRTFLDTKELIEELVFG
jgi:hypothetical protein